MIPVNFMVLVFGILPFTTHHYIAVWQKPSLTEVSEIKRVCVVGNVINPSVIEYRGEIKLTDAIWAAGGIPHNRKSEKVRVMMRVTDDPSVWRVFQIKLQGIKEKPYMNVRLQPYEVVEVLPRKYEKGYRQNQLEICAAMYPAPGTISR